MTQALKLLNDILTNLPDAIQSVHDTHGFAVQQINITVQQHPITGFLTITIDRNSSLCDLHYLTILRTLANAHDAHLDHPALIEAELPTAKPVTAQKTTKKGKRTAP